MLAIRSTRMPGGGISEFTQSVSSQFSLNLRKGLVKVSDDVVGVFNSD